MEKHLSKFMINILNKIGIGGYFLQKISTKKSAANIIVTIYGFLGNSTHCRVVHSNWYKLGEKNCTCLLSDQIENKAKMPTHPTSSQHLTGVLSNFNEMRRKEGREGGGKKGGNKAEKRFFFRDDFIIYVKNIMNTVEHLEKSKLGTPHKSQQKKYI
jgi:spore coat protein CotH